MILASLVRFYLLHNYNIIRLHKVLLVACKLQAILYRDSVLHYLCRVILCVECTASEPSHWSCGDLRETGGSYGYCNLLLPICDSSITVLDPPPAVSGHIASGPGWIKE